MSTLQQNTPEWLEMRKDHIGASDAPIIEGISPYKTAFQLWQEKLDISAPQEESYIQKMGHDIEPEARALLEKMADLCLSPKVMFHPRISWMMASLDAVDLGGSVIAEMKMASKEDHERAAGGEIPERHIPQLHHQMEVAGVGSMLYFSFHRGDGKIVEIYKDEEYIKNLISKEEAFYSCLKNLVPPALTQKDYVEVDSDERLKLASEWMKISSALSALEKQEKELREALISTSPNQSSTGGGVKISKCLRKGSVDYSKIPQLHDVNLEIYRKKPIEYYKLSVI